MTLRRQRNWLLSSFVVGPLANETKYEFNPVDVETEFRFGGRIDHGERCESTCKSA